MMSCLQNYAAQSQSPSPSQSRCFFKCSGPESAMDAAEDYSKNLNGSGPCPYASADEMSSKEDSGDMTFCMAKYAKEALKMMFMMRSHHMLTDVILEVEKEVFHVHKVVLSAASPYFKAMFTGGLKESEMSQVKLQGVCPTAMARMIYFMYTGHIRVTEVTVCQLLPAATMFQVPHVIEACCAFLERQLDPTNAIGISNFAEQHGCDSLKQKAIQFIERHFTQICQEEEFLQMSAIQLISLVRKDELNVQGEREVYNAVLKWVKYDEDNRYPKMEHILYAVRCQFLTPNFLKEQMKNCDVLRKVPACREYLARIFKDLTLHKRPIVKERRPNTTRMIFVAGGYLRGSLDIVEGFNVDDKTWTTLPQLRVPRSGLGAAFLKGTFYAVGGRNNTPGSSYDSDWVDRYNPITEQWRPCAPMSVPRHRVGVAVMDELLYAVGGSAGSEYHNTVEYFDPEEDRWNLVQPMHSKRLGVGIAVVNRLLYSIGGFDGNDRLATVECYHPENNEWTMLPSMKLGRSGAGVAALNQFIYVVGGFDGQGHLSSVERFDTEQQVWETAADIKIARSALSLTVLDGKLFAMGGFDGQNFLSIVEVYDPIRNVWEEGTPLTSGRSGHASAVIYQPSCANYSECSDTNPEKDCGPDKGNESSDQSEIGSNGSTSSYSTTQGNGDLKVGCSSSGPVDTTEDVSNSNSPTHELTAQNFSDNLLDFNLIKSMCENKNSSDSICLMFRSKKSKNLLYMEKEEEDDNDDNDDNNKSENATGQGSSKNCYKIKDGSKHAESATCDQILSGDNTNDDVDYHLPCEPEDFNSEASSSKSCNQMKSVVENDNDLLNKMQVFVFTNDTDKTDCKNIDSHKSKTSETITKPQLTALKTKHNCFLPCRKLNENPKKYRRKPRHQCATLHKFREVRNYYDVMKQNFNSIVMSSSKKIHNSLKLKCNKSSSVPENKQIDSVSETDKRTTQEEEEEEETLKNSC